jgi:hypothetical protein
MGKAKGADRHVFKKQPSVIRSVSTKNFFMATVAGKSNVTDIYSKLSLKITK